ncbi:MAG: TolC family protein [Vicinamibacterales bacterium]
MNARTALFPLLLTVALALAPAAARAQEPMALTLDEAVSRALEASHQMAEGRAREAGARATVELRRTADQPIVQVTGGYTRTNHIDEFGISTPGAPPRIIYPDLPDNVTSRVSLAWPIYTGGRTDALERAAEAEARATAADIEITRADLKLEVTRAYWAYATAVDAARVIEEALKRADQHLADVRNRLDVGLVPPNDVLSAEAQRARQQMQLIEARNQRDAAAIDLRRLTGMAEGQAIQLAPLSGRGDEPDEASRAGDLVTAALDARPERRALQIRIEGAEARQEAAAAGRRPTVALAGGVDYANPNPRIFPREDKWQTSWDVGVNVSWSLWDAGRTRAEAAEAAAAATAVRERLAELDTRVAADVRQRLLDIDSSRAAIDAAEAGRRAAAEALRVVNERYRAGVATNTDVLDAEVALLESELDRTRAIANLRLAEARLDRTVGR